MSQLQEIRDKLETEVAFEASAEIGLNLLVALEAVHELAAQLQATGVHPDGDMFSKGWDAARIHSGKQILDEIALALA